MFCPPRCPYRSCSQHTDPESNFFTRHGSFKPRCRPHDVPRFRCRSCGRTFSRQTFRADFRDNRPSLNPRLFLLIASGVGLRQSSRLLKLSRRCTELKFRKIARHLRRLNLNLRDRTEGSATFHLDEIETFEGQRNARPLSVPVLIESNSRFIVWAESAPIRPRGSMTPKRLRLIARSERRHGKRKDGSRRSLKRTFQRAVELVHEHSTVTLLTDEKSSYPGLAARAFRGHRIIHQQTNSKLVRDTFNSTLR